MDIRGTQRPIHGSKLDIGAYDEFSGKSLAATGISGLSINNEIDYSNITSTSPPDGTRTWTTLPIPSPTIMRWVTAAGPTILWIGPATVSYAGHCDRVRTCNSVTYYISVRIKNAAGEVLGTLFTDGIFIDTEDPIISGISDGNDAISIGTAP